MAQLTISTLTRYIHHLQELQQTLLDLQFTEAAAVAAENIRIAESYLELLRKNSS